MPLSEFELHRCERDLGRFLDKRRPPPAIRHELDIGYRITGQSVELFEVRPDWQNPAERMEHPFAKATFVRSQGHWRVFWQRQDLKWHGYQPMPTVRDLADFLACVDEDPYGCFFG